MSSHLGTVRFYIGIEGTKLCLCRREIEFNEVLTFPFSHEHEAIHSACRKAATRRVKVG